MTGTTNGPQYCIRKCINGCLVHKGIHHKNIGPNTNPWTDEEVILCARMDEIARAEGNTTLGDKR